MTTDIKLAVIRAAIVLIASYGTASLTEKMVYVVPTLVTAGFFAAAIKSDNTALRVDEEGAVMLVVTIIITKTTKGSDDAW